MRSLRDRLRGAQPVIEPSSIDDDAVTVWNNLYTLVLGRSAQSMTVALSTRIGDR